MNRNYINDYIKEIEYILKNLDLYSALIADIESEKVKQIHTDKFYIVHCILESDRFLDPEELKFVRLKYFEKKDIFTIADELNISPRTVSRFRIKVLNKILIRSGLYERHSLRLIQYK